MQQYLRSRSDASGKDVELFWLGSSTKQVVLSSLGFEPGSNHITFYKPNSVDTVDYVNNIPYAETTNGSGYTYNTFTRDDLDVWIEANIALILEDYMSSYELDLGSFTPDYHLNAFDTKDMSDVVTVDYKREIARGAVINSPMTATYKTWKALTPINGEITTTTLVTSISSLLSGDLGPPPTMSGRYLIYVTLEFLGTTVGVTEPAVNAIHALLPAKSFLGTSVAYNDALSRLNDAEFDALLFAAEFGKTAAHLASVGKRIANIQKAIKTGRFSKLAPKTFQKWKTSRDPSLTGLSLDILADAWLEARYAIRPLLIDAENAYDYLTKGGLTPRRTFRGGENSSSVSSLPETTFTTSGINYTVNGTLTSTMSARAGIMCHVNPSVAADLGLLNFASTAWELIPFSFVVDWFLNVGGVLASLTPTPHLETLASWVSLSTEHRIEGVINCLAPDGSSNSVNFSLSRSDKDRVVDMPPPSLTFDVNYDIAKLLDTAALLRRILG